MLKMVDGTGIIGVDMICPLGGTVSPPQPPNYDKVEVEGVGSLMLPNSLEAPVERVELIGNSVQPTTTGKNLFDIKKASDVSNYITTETLAKIDITAAIVFDVKKNTNYCLSVSGKTDQPSINFNIANDVQRKSIFNKLKTEETLNSLDSGKIYVGFSGGDTELNATKLSQEYFDIQLEEASSKTPYEPYTGGKPSPSPEYPQEIKSVGQWNEEKQKYEVDVKVTGKNLLNEEHFFDMKNWKNNQYNMRLQPNTQYVFSRRDNVEYGSNIFLSIKNTKDDRFSQIINSNSQPTNKQSVKFKTKETGLVWFLVQNNSGINLKDMLGYAQIEVGEISTEHELYKEQTLTLTSDRPITKWDKLVEQDGQIGWLYGGKIIESYNSEPIDTEYISSTGELSAGVTVLYKLKEAEFVPLPQSEQNAIRALKTYYPTTVITVDGGELDPDIKVTYRKEI